MTDKESPTISGLAVATVPEMIVARRPESMVSEGTMSDTTIEYPAGLDFAPRGDPEEREFPCDAAGEKRVGLALSGGGLRATLFHLGALMRLRELGQLQRIDRFSGVSGGSIMGAILARGWSELARREFSADAFSELVTRPTLAFARHPIDVPVIAAGLIPTVNPAGLLDRWFDRSLTHGMRLADLPETPRFIFNAAHIATGVSWRFQKAYMGDWRIGVVCRPDVRLSTAIAASAAFPPFVAPLALDLEAQQIQPTEGADALADARFEGLRQRVLLLDGGAYDNLGIEPLEGRCRIVLASDAGGNLKLDARRARYRLWWPLIRRTLDMAVEVGRTQRRRALIDRATAARNLPEHHELRAEFTTEHVALWRTSNDLTDHDTLPQRLPVAPGWDRYLSTRPTRLWPMDRYDRDHLINWGYLTSDVMLRKWHPDLEGVAEPSQLPMSGAAFSDPPRN